MPTENDTMLAEMFHCGQCQLNLSHLAFAQRVAHMKKCCASLSSSEQQDVLPQELQESLQFSRAFIGGASACVSASSSGRIPLQPLRAATGSVREWLTVLDMGDYADAFEKEEVDMRALPLLSDEDLIYLGVTSGKQRKALLAAAKDLLERSAVPALPQTSTPRQCGPSPAPQGCQVETKSMTGVTLPSVQRLLAKQHEQSSLKSNAQKNRPQERSRDCTSGRAAPISDGVAPHNDFMKPSSKAVPKRQQVSSAAPAPRAPKAAHRSQAANSHAQPSTAASRDMVELDESIVPESEEDSDFVDDRPASRLPSARKRAKPSAGLPSTAPASGGGQSKPQAATAAPSSVEEERDQLERALVLSLGARGDTGSLGSQPSLLSSTGPAGAVQPAPSTQPPGYLSSALGRVLAARNSRGRVSQNRTYSRQTEQRLLDMLYPPGRHAKAGSCGDFQKGGSSRVEEEIAGQSGWSSDDDEDAGQKKGSSSGEGTHPARFRDLLSRSNIGRSGSVERIPPERSLWALAGQSGPAALPASSLQQRFAARKAADLAQQAALAASKAENQASDASRADICKSGELGTRKAMDEEAADGHCSVKAKQCHSLQKPAASKHGRIASQAAMRVEAVREELIAAEATIAELKKYLAEAEKELELEQQHGQRLPRCKSFLRS